MIPCRLNDSTLQASRFMTTPAADEVQAEGDAVWIGPTAAFTTRAAGEPLVSAAGVAFRLNRNENQ